MAHVLEYESSDHHTTSYASEPAVKCLRYRHVKGSVWKPGGFILGPIM